MRFRNLVYGGLGTFALLSFYVVLMSLLGRSWQATWKQFVTLAWLMIPLALGFGVQVGMYSALRQAVQARTKGVLAAGGTSASAGMVACCAHHLADVLPFLGLSGISIFLIRYQVPILLLSLGINIVGIAVMYKHLRTMRRGS